MNTGKSLRIALAIKEKNQQWLADELGVKKQMVSYWINGTSLKSEIVSNICCVLEYKPSEFIALGEEK